MADKIDFTSEEFDDEFDPMNLASWGMDIFSSMLVGGVFISKKQMSPERLQKHLQEHPNTRKKHVKKEKELRDIVLRAAECGYADVMHRALPLLDEVQRRLKQNPESKSVLNFCEGKGGGSPPWNKQV